MSSEQTGLLFHTTDKIREFINAACSYKDAVHYRDADIVPYSLVKDLWSKMPPEERPSFYELLAGSTFAFPKPKPREKSKELQERLQKLQELADRKAYKELVKDVVKETEDVVPFSTYKDQLGFGLHVIVTMFTGFLLGFAFFRSQFQHTPVLHVVGGLLGLFAGMILETTLFIVRDHQRQNSSRFKRKTRPRHGNLDTKKKRQ